MARAGALAALRPGSLWIDLTTNRKELVAKLAADAPDGVDVVDAPVTGAVDGARTGRLTVFAGGDRRRSHAPPRSSSTSGTVIACGPLGTGNVVKLVTNQLWFVAAAAIGEGFALGMSHGVDLDVLDEAIRNSVGDSFVARHDAPSIFAGHYDPSFTVDLCLKDLGLLEELQADVASPLPLTDAARAAFADAGDALRPRRRRTARREAAGRRHRTVVPRGRRLDRPVGGDRRDDGRDREAWSTSTAIPSTDPVDRRTVDAADRPRRAPNCEPTDVRSSATSSARRGAAAQRGDRRASDARTTRPR